MGSNWLHVQDGMGDAGDRTNDLTVTSQQKAAVRDVVFWGREMFLRLRWAGHNIRSVHYNQNRLFVGSSG